MITMSNELNHYIRVKIGEAKSKEEEDLIVKNNIVEIQNAIQKKIISEKERWEIILRIIYAEMLGHNTDFAHFFIVNSVQSSSYRVKRIAYLACLTILEEDSPFRIMMVASLQKDLENKCLYNKIIALNTLTKILCPLNASAFVDILQKELVSQHVVIRKKSILAIIRLEEILPGAIEHFDDVLEKALRDKEASIMMAVLPYYAKQAKFSPEKYKSKLIIFIQIFQQILERKLSKDYDYDDHPAPWSIIKLLQIFSDLSRNDKKQSEMIYNSLKTYIKSFVVLSTDVDVVLLFQTTLTLLQIYPNEELILISLDKLEILRLNGFLKKNNTTLLVLKIISKLVEIDSRYIENYQMLLLDCLDSEDETIKHLTINILFKNITSSNIEIVVKKIEEFIENAIDLNFKNMTINKLYRVIEQKAPNPIWFLNKSLEIIHKGNFFISNDIIESVIHNLIEIFLYEENDKNQLAGQFLEIFKEFIEQKNLNDGFISIFIWFLGEFFELVENFFPLENLIELINYLLKFKFTTDSTLSYFYTGLQKIKTKTNNSQLYQEIQKIMKSRVVSQNTESQLRLREYINYNNKNKSIFKIDEIDLNFNFLSNFVSKNLEKGGKTYQANFRQKKKQIGSDLVIKYTKKQIEDNMKKNMDGAEKEFKYKGKAKWSQEGFKGDEVNKTNVFGVSEKDKKNEIKKEIKFTFNNDVKEEEKQPLSENTNKQKEEEKVIKKVSKKKKNINKKMKIKTKMASSLFGATKLEVKPKKGEILFLEKPVMKQSNQILNFSEKKSEEVDFLNFDNKVEKTKKEIISPYKITLEKYEELWEKLENVETEKKLNIKIDYESLQILIQNKGFYIVDIMETEFVSAGKKEEDIVLLYMGFDENGEHDLIFRGNNQIVENLMKEFG